MGLELEQANGESLAVEAGPALEPVESGYKNVLRVRMAVLWLILWAGGVACDFGFPEADSILRTADHRNSRSLRPSASSPRRGVSTTAFVTA